METQLVEQEIVNVDPIVLERMARIQRKNALKSLWLSALESKPNHYTRKMLYELAIQQRVLDIDSYNLFVRDLKDIEDDKEIPSELLKADMKAERTPDLFQKSHIQKILKVFYEQRKVGLSVAFLLGYRECLRLGEIAKLRWSDISFEGKYIMIRDSKWAHRGETRRNEGKTAPVPLFEDVALVLKKYKEYCEIAKDTEYVFPSPKNPINHIKPKTLFERFIGVLKEVGLRGQDQVLYEYRESKGRNKHVKKLKYRLYFHSLRHGGACYWLQKTKNIEFVKLLLRHRDISTTEVYARLTTDELKKSFEDAEKHVYHQIKQQLSLQEQQQLIDKMIRQDQESQAQVVIQQHKLRNDEIEKLTTLKDKEAEILRLQCKLKGV